VCKKIPNTGDAVCSCGYLFPGTMLNQRWNIMRFLAAAGQGITYVAHDGNQIGVVKAMLPAAQSSMGFSEQEMIQRFQQEADTLKLLTHPKIPKIFDVFSESGSHYFVMEYIDGEDLGAIFRRDGAKSGLPEELVLAWFIEVLDVINYLHSLTQPVCHRDIKPANVMRRNDSAGSVVVLDFGTARPPTKQAGETQCLGTYGYAAPEQYQGAVEPRSDIYALGMMMHQFLTAQNPEDYRKRLDKDARARLAAISMFRTDVSDETIQVVERATRSRSPEFSSAREMRDALIYAYEKKYRAYVAPGSGTATVRLPLPQATVILPVTYQTQLLPDPIQPAFRRVNTRDNAEVIWIPPSSFRFGTNPQDIMPMLSQLNEDPEDLLAETPDQDFNIPSGLWMYRYPVTNIQYMFFLRANPQFSLPSEWDRRAKCYPQGKDFHPVVGVTWEDAYAYAYWVGARLPTEVEWEYAARGPAGNLFPWGTDSQLHQHCHCSVQYQQNGTAAVNQYPSGMSVFGCFDMVGNIREWTSTRWGPYPGANYPHAAYGKDYYVTRGSSWQEWRQYKLRCATRSFYQRTVANAVLGFRCVIDNP